ncbi:ribonuclease HII [candidate division WOR-1 bacterium RIFOXYA12_FULL_43_27]|uniref:Ribonuclease HII n=1 Tax=candidate division WOR-1 bacterium RIFOXYC2_FULL_46_14 TaxID=1802587 RepID=A0A1F4U4X8_UNCSA|nr:MAG: ribonuclease HII [candidate division WOR-1 bacterium RIFOXYA12_FULL_43_27]OGC20654.1 MAG: ribonuclease HII [candidate division WOR-1 bacterium RIFOXYB2_FULL_46_45]OGC31609.1 MAG: ribonuclease HII [candidate division WOR-1 bacterium RIFOXYA2_FULL_46_56]OGC40014.1 MAG: ribonuclease HII [candidate division WOR-1 bacterium RIFOXYC2_FULL_46_14]
MTPPSFRYEQALYKKGCRLVAGVDEAGRGPLAGPLVAAAVILTSRVEGLDDSKLLSSSEREKIFKIIAKEALAIGIGVVSHKVIDRINIHCATLLAMKQAVLNLVYYPDYLLVDGKFKIDVDFPQTAIIAGDKRCYSIAAASVVAKVTRDRMMLRYHKKFPQYQFDRHKGYGTQLHLECLEKHGPSPIHRVSFAPVKELI